MSEVVNHAEVIRDTLGMLDPCHRRAYFDALTALDALTRELEEQKALYLHDTQVLSCLGAEDHERANKAEATIAAQSERIAKLEEVLENLVSWVENMGEFDLEDPVWFATVREARAALAPKEVQE